MESFGLFQLYLRLFISSKYQELNSIHMMVLLFLELFLIWHSLRMKYKRPINIKIILTCFIASQFIGQFLYKIKLRSIFISLKILLIDTSRNS